MAPGTRTRMILTKIDMYSDLGFLGQVFTFGADLREEPMIAVPPTG